MNIHHILLHIYLDHNNIYIYIYIHKQFLSSLTFEDSHYDLQIYKINEENYNYLLDEIQNNITKIEENYETIKYNPECQNSDYISVF